MKTINKYFLLAALGGMFAFTSCSDDIEREASPLVPAECPQAAFSSENEYEYELEPEAATEITLMLTRAETNGAATVGIEVLKNDENVFDVPETVTFADGEKEAPLTIKFPNAAVGTSYGYSLKVKDGDHNPYSVGDAYILGSIVRIKWNPIPVTVYTDGMISALYGVNYPLSWYVNAEYAEFPDGSMRVRVKNPYCVADDVDDNGIFNGNPYFDAENIVNPNVIMAIDINGKEALMAPFYFGALLNSSEGELLGGSIYGALSNSKDNYPLGEVTYGEEGKLASIVFGPNSLFGSIKSLWEQKGSAWPAENPTTMYFFWE